MKRLIIPLIFSTACVNAETFSNIPSFIEGTVSSISGLGSEARFSTDRTYASLFTTDGAQKVGLAYGRFSPISRYQSVGIGARTYYDNQTKGTTTGVEAVQEGEIPGAYSLLRSSTRIGVSYSTDQSSFAIYGSYTIIPTILSYSIPLKIARTPDTGSWGMSAGVRYIW